jgi:hypothetical protein
VAEYGIGEFAGSKRTGAADRRTITGAIDTTTSPVITVSMRQLGQRVATNAAGILIARARGHELSTEIGC